VNPLEELVRNFQELAAQVPEFVQPFVVMLAGAVPFVEGELAAMIGVVAGLNPVIAGLAGALGNFLVVLAIVAVTSRARTAVVDARAARRRARAASLVGVGGRGLDDLPDLEPAQPAEYARPESKGRARFLRWLVRFGVPGASIIGPFAIPTHFMAAILVSAGTPRAWVLLWQAVSIALWTTVGTVSVWAALTYVVGI